MKLPNNYCLFGNDFFCICSLEILRIFLSLISHNSQNQPFFYEREKKLNRVSQLESPFKKLFYPFLFLDFNSHFITYN